MTLLSIQTVSARSVSVLINQPTSCYELPQALNWRLKLKAGATIQSGTAKSAACYFENLTPETEYILEIEHAVLPFKTQLCNGLLNILEFGASTDSNDNTAAIQNTINAVKPGGTVKIPTGLFHSGPLFLKADMTLWLESGAELNATADRSSWPILAATDAQGRVTGTWEGVAEACYASLLTCIDCDDLTITGKGTIDGGGAIGDWWSWPKETRNNARRARTIFIAHSKRVNVSGIKVQNSPSWTIHPYKCDELCFSAMHIYNPSDSPNTDGLNPESCTNVNISAIHFSVGDDCIAIKSGKRSDKNTHQLDPTSEVHIHHCRMERGHGAVVLGSEMSGTITDVDISHCEFHSTDRGLRLKTRRGRGGRINNISIQHVIMNNVATPIAANAFYFCDSDGKSNYVQSREPAPYDETTPVIENIRVSDVTATNVSIAAAALLGLPESPITNVVIENFKVSYKTNSQAEVPLMALGVEPMSCAGIYAEYAHIQGQLDLCTEKPAC